LESTNKPNRSYIKHVTELLDKDRPGLSGAIIKELSNCTSCVKEMSMPSLEFLISWLDKTPVPNETLLVLSKYFTLGYSNSDYVVSISNVLNYTRFAGARVIAEEEFYSSIATGRTFKPEVFTNFDVAAKAGRITRETIGFLAYAAKYELYILPREISVEWFKFLLEDSLKLLEEYGKEADELKRQKSKKIRRFWLLMHLQGLLSLSLIVVIQTYLMSLKLFAMLLRMNIGLSRSMQNIGYG
jgi:hypothetical protein